MMRCRIRLNQMLLITTCNTKRNGYASIASCHQHLLFHDRMIEIPIRIDFADFKYVNLLVICLASYIGDEEIDVLPMIFFRERS